MKILSNTNCSVKFRDFRKIVYIHQIQGGAKISLKETLILKVIFSKCMAMIISGPKMTLLPKKCPLKFLQVISILNMLFSSSKTSTVPGTI